MYDSNSNATELTPLTEGLYSNKSKYKYNSLLSTNSNGFNYYIHLIKYIWSQISIYFWKLLIFLLILIIINTILRSLFKKETNLIFTSMNNDNTDILNSNYMLSNNEIPLNLIWIVTDFELQTENSNYLNTLTKQGILLENYHISIPPATYSMNRISSLLSKYVYKLTDNDIDNNYFNTFISKQYQIHKLYDITLFNDYIDNIDQSFPLLIYIILDKQQSMNIFENKIKQMMAYLKLKKNNKIWENMLFIINSDNNAFSLLYGPRIPNKNRGLKSQILFHSVDWLPTLLHFDMNDINQQENDNIYDGFDLWNSLIYNKISPRKNIPMQQNIQITDNKINNINI